MRHWLKLAALLLAVACAEDATTPAEPENRAPEAVADNPGDRAALEALYEATDGPNWTNNENWLTDAPLSEWHGVAVSGGSDRRVTGLNLRDNDLTGPIPPELVNLASLQSLHLNSNGLTGPIPPELVNLASLQSLHLGGNGLTGPIPPELGGFARLESLSLGGQDLTGPIPPELGNLASLQRLDLAFIYGLTGPIPSELGNLASLQSLNLGGNDLTGRIPSELGNLAGLWFLNLSNNGLSGPIPPELGSLASLEALLLSGNDLTGPIPLELGSLASLQLLVLGRNALTDPIPPELGNLTSLQELLLGNNGLTGPIPPELGSLASLQRLTLHKNGLTGAIPLELGNLTSLHDLHLGLNPGVCAPADPKFRAWLIKLGASPYPCRSNSDARLLPLALMREDGNGLSLLLPDDLHGGPAVRVSDPGVVAASVADGWLVLEPRSIGRADVELVPSGGGSPAVAVVAVREALGTFGIDIVAERPVPLAFEETAVAVADWWSSVLNGTDWKDRRLSEWCSLGNVTALADELLIQAGSDDDPESPYGYASPCQWFDPSTGSIEYGGGYIGVRQDHSGSVRVWRHEIGHILGLVSWPSETGLTTGDERYFTGPRAVEAFRAGGGDPGLPGVPLEVDGCGCHWDWAFVGGELMGSGGGYPDALSFAALADAGYTVDMTKATPWRKQDNAAAAVTGERFPGGFRDSVEVRIVRRPVPGGGR